MEPLIRRTVELMGDVYPELRENEAFVLQVATSEEERFAATLRQGLQLFGQAAERTQAGRVVPGDDAFKLSDTFGFPLQLTQELAADAGLEVDVDRFAELLEEQRRRAREAAKKVPIGARHRRGAARRSSWDTSTWRPRGRSWRCSTRRAVSCRWPRRARRSASSWTSRRSTRRAAARSAITARSARRPA